jgi:hypothetical protein
VKIVVWDENTKIMNSELFEAGLLIQIIGGYCKKNQKGCLEVHLGKKGKIMLSPDEVSERTRKKLEAIKVDPSVSVENARETNENTQIEDFCEKDGFISKVVGQVRDLDLKEIDKKNGEKIFLLKFLLLDETGSIQCLVWNMKAIEVLKIININDVVEIQNILLKKNLYSNEKELQFIKKTLFRLK